MSFSSLTSQTLLILVPNPSFSLRPLAPFLSLSYTHGGSLSLTHTHGGCRLPLSWPKPIFPTTIFHFLLKSMPWRHLTRDFRASHHHHCYYSMPTALIWCQTCLGLCFWVCISISGFGSLFVFGFVCQMSREHLTRSTSFAITIGNTNTGGYWSLSSFFVLIFFSLLVWFFVCLGLSQFTDWVFLCDIRIWWFFIWVWNGVWVWLFAELWVFFDLGFVSKWF